MTSGSERIYALASSLQILSIVAISSSESFYAKNKELRSAIRQGTVGML